VFQVFRVVCSLIIAKVQAFVDAAFIARNILVYCLCSHDRSLILDSNNWYQSPGYGEESELKMSTLKVRDSSSNSPGDGAPRTVAEHVIGGMVEIPKSRRGIRSCWWWPARGGDQRRWCDEATGRVSVCGGAGHVVALVRWSRSIGVCGRRNDVCRREEGNGVCAKMGHAEVATSGRKAMVAAVAMMMMAVA
jgi:hypothetical protein